MGEKRPPSIKLTMPPERLSRTLRPRTPSPSTGHLARQQLGMAGVRGRGPAGAAEFMGRRGPPVGPRSLGAPNRRRQGCALCRDPSGVESRATRATTHGPRTGVVRLTYDINAVTRTVRCDWSARGGRAESMDASSTFHCCAGYTNHYPTAA